VAIKAIKEMAKGPVKLGLVGIPVPISRIGVDTAEKLAATLGMETVDKEFIPPTAADYTPFANKIKSADANWGYAYAPWPAEAKTFEALRRLGWTGTYLAYGHIQAEDELARIGDPGLQVFMANSLFQDNLPVHKEIRDAAAAGKYQFPATYGTEGWLSGRILEQILTKTGWPASAEKVTAAMSSLNLDTRAFAAGRWCGRRKIISEPSNTIGSITTIRRRRASCGCATGLRWTLPTDTALTAAQAWRRRRISQVGCPHVAATRRQCFCAGRDLRAGERRLRAGL